jgi:hypothetical protein
MGKTLKEKNNKEQKPSPANELGPPSLQRLRPMKAEQNKHVADEGNRTLDGF